MRFAKKVYTSRLPLEYFDLHALCNILRGLSSSAVGEDTKPASSRFLARPILIHLDDLSIFNRLLRPSDRRVWMDGGYRELFRLTFALRHQIGRLALIAHARVLEHATDHQTSDHYTAMDEVLCRSVKSELLEYRSLVSPEFWHKENAVNDLFPVFGTSALGCHILFSRLKTCRAFDPYTATQCTARTEDLFCENHASEAWWIPKNDGPRSTFAKMSLFYAIVQNAESYNEDDLGKMVGEFWEQYLQTTRIDTVSQDEIERAARDFGVADTDALRAMGLSGLKEMYFRQALKRHPDVGGSKENFIALKTNFELLKKWMSA